MSKEERTVREIESDMLKFRRKSSWKYSRWLSSKYNERERFVIEYMIYAGITEDYLRYSTVMYGLMCREWRLQDTSSHREDSEENEKGIFGFIRGSP